MEERPVIKVPLTATDKWVEKTALVLWLLMLAYTVYLLIYLPAIIPVHFNASGKADNYGNKFTILILPGVASLIYLGMSQLNKYPHVFNYTTKITAENAAAQYAMATRMLRYVKLGVLIVITVIMVSVHLTIAGFITGPGPWLLPFIFLVMLGPMIVLLVNSLKKK